MNNKNIFIISAFLLVFLSLSGASCNWFSKNNANSASPTPTATNTATTAAGYGQLLTASPSAISSLFNSNLTQAEAKAKSWKQDAKLYAVNIKLPKNLGTNQAIETFIFGSDQDKNYWWTDAISENSGNFVRAIVPKEDYLSEVKTPINNNYWKINYLDALLIAEDNGGKAFREKDPDSQISLNLYNSQPKGWLWWLVEYKNTNGESLKVRINANDQSVVDESGTVITTGSSTSQ
ncbi:MAG: hypothetical protein M1338_05700 [Patescibacteria group bacterium]|nr:hypothetical protein [Patescibacteria group bacterium]